MKHRMSILHLDPVVKGNNIILESDDGSDNASSYESDETPSRKDSGSGGKS